MEVDGTYIEQLDVIQNKAQAAGDFKIALAALQQKIDLKVNYGEMVSRSQTTSVPKEAKSEKVTTYCGRLITELSRDELIEALKFAAEEIARIERDHERTRNMQSLFREARTG